MKSTAPSQSTKAANKAPNAITTTASASMELLRRSPVADHRSQAAVQANAPRDYSRAVAAATANGAVGAVSSEGLADKLTRPRAVWVMVPSGEPTEQTIDDLAEVLEPDDT